MVEPLIESLRAEDTDVRTAATQAVGQIGQPAVEPLIERLGDHDSDMREAAADALTQHGGPATCAGAQTLSEEVGLRRGRQGLWGKAGSERHMNACEACIRFLQEALDGYEYPLSAMGTSGYYELHGSLKDALPKWKRAFRLGSGVPKGIKQPLRDLVHTAQQLLK